MSRHPLFTPSQRSVLLSICSALYGLAIAISTYPLWLRPAPPEQLPGFMSAHGLDARASYGFFATVVLVTLATPLLLRSVVERLTRADTRAWARNGAAAAMLAALWSVSLLRNLAWTVVPAAIAILACVVLRRVDMNFSRRDVILVPTIAAVFLSIVDLTNLAVAPVVILATAAVLTLRLAMAWHAPRQEGWKPAPHLLFALSPLALLLQTRIFAGAYRYAGWPALVIALGTPIVLPIFLHDSPAARKRLRLAIAIIVYPLALFACADATSLQTAAGGPRVSFFEDGQHLVAAHEILHGERPYIDIIPPHGLIEDALLDATILRHGSQTVGRVMTVRGAIALLIPVVTYAMAAAATGSADAALLAVFAAMIFGYTSATVRFLPALVCIAVAAWAVRRQSRLVLAAAAAMAIATGLMSIDQGIYAIVTVTAASLLVRPRLQSTVAAAAGALVVSLLACTAMLAGGYLAAFFRVTFFELGTLRSVYALAPFEPPPGFARPLPALLTGVFDVRAIPLFLWLTTLVCIAAVIGRRRSARRWQRIGPAAVIAVWIVAAGLSYAERHHLYFTYAMMPLAAAAIWRLWHSRGPVPRVAAIAVTAVLLIAGSATQYLAEIGFFRHARGRGPLTPGFTSAPLPRAAGGYYDHNDVATLMRVNRYVQSHLRPDETFFDFTNRGLLYFLLDRDDPVRQIEVAFYETVAAQQEVIDRIEHNPRVRCAIVPGPVGGTIIDGIPNAVRAPLVWKYLQEHFEPDYAEGDVVIWKRK